MLPIPKRLLPHNIKVSLPDPDAGYEGEYLPPFVIQNVRFESVEVLNPSSYKLSDGAKGRIWIDSVNSKSAFTLPLGAKVEMGNISATVLSCTPCFAGSNVHHWEVDVGWE